MIQLLKTTSAVKNIEIIWSNYLDILSQRWVKENTKRWVVKRAEAFSQGCAGSETAWSYCRRHQSLSGGAGEGDRKK